MDARLSSSRHCSQWIASKKNCASTKVLWLKEASMFARAPLFSACLAPLRPRLVSSSTVKQWRIFTTPQCMTFRRSCLKCNPRSSRYFRCFRPFREDKQVKPPMREYFSYIMSIAHHHALTNLLSFKSRKNLIVIGSTLPSITTIMYPML